ncbi:MAG: DJ-1/PfpI family protein, partial [Saprospiraceae bacterium]|nr:DJ-1/PfpI family protein [Pyrinomonadaceae bacterium]
AMTKLIAPKLGPVKTAGGGTVKADEAFFLSTSVVYDGVFIAGGKGLAAEADAIHFVNEAYKHCKAIAAIGSGMELLQKTYVDPDGEGIVTKGDGKTAARDFINAIAQHRFWSREDKSKIPA